MNMHFEAILKKPLLTRPLDPSIKGELSEIDTTCKMATKWHFFLVIYGSTLEILYNIGVCFENTKQTHNYVHSNSTMAEGGSKFICRTVFRSN